MATLKDLARSLNLSVMAVSKALRDAPDISKATKERVQAEARRRNYVPNRAAQNLRLKNSGLIGVVVPNINHTYYSHLVWGIERQAESLGFQILLAHSSERGDVELAEIRKLVSRQVQGVVMVPAVRLQHRLASLELLQESGVPAVLLDRYPAGVEQFPRVGWVVSKDQQGAELATRHLLDLGHREILFLAGPNGSSSAAARFSGYQRAMNLSKVGFDDRRIFLAGQDIEAGKQAMSQALSENITFTAVVAFNDSVAMGAIEILLQQGFRVPEQVSVTGFGDGLLAMNYRVPLTTLHVPQVEMGTAAVHLLKELMDGERTSSREMPVEMVVRQSTAAAALG
jgi:DNA-binding LacI/PurR family transcriptional regulator